MTTPTIPIKIARALFIAALVILGMILAALFTSPLYAPMGIMHDWDSAPNLRNSSSLEYSSVNMMKSGMMGEYYALEDRATASSTGESETKVIKNGTLLITAENVDETVKDVRSLAGEYGGLVQSSSISEDRNGKTTAFVVIRVPVESFEAALNGVKDLAAHVDSESLSGTDVTETYIDLSARLTAAKAQEAQYLIILRTATTVGEVLAVEEHLADVRANIESLQGQLNYLENSTDLATISVSISEEPSAQQAATGTFNPLRDANAALAVVVLLGQFALSAIIWVVILGLAVGIPVGIALLAYRAMVRRRSNTPKRRK